MVPHKQFLVNVPFQSTKHRKKKLCVDNKVQETIGDVYCPTCRNEKCVYNSTNKTSSFCHCKKCKACCHVSKFPFNDQKLTIMLFCGDGTHCLARKTSRDYEKQKASLFWGNFSANHSHLHQKRLNWVQIGNKLVRSLLADDLSHIFNFQIILFNFNLQSTSQI